MAVDNGEVNMGLRPQLEIEWPELRKQMTTLAMVLPKYGTHASKWAGNLTNALNTPGTPVDVLSIAGSNGMGLDTQQAYTIHLVDIGQDDDGVHCFARMRGNGLQQAAFFRAELYGDETRFYRVGEDKFGKPKDVKLIGGRWDSMAFEPGQDYIALEPYKMKEFKSRDSKTPGLLEAKLYTVNTK